LKGEIHLQFAASFQRLLINLAKERGVATPKTNDCSSIFGVAATINPLCQFFSQQG
jgi:hypothetical protein